VNQISISADYLACFESKPTLVGMWTPKRQSGVWRSRQ